MTSLNLHSRKTKQQNPADTRESFKPHISDEWKWNLGIAANILIGITGAIAKFVAIENRQVAYHMDHFMQNHPNATTQIINAERAKVTTPLPQQILIASAIIAVMAVAYCAYDQFKKHQEKSKFRAAGYTKDMWDY